MAETLTIKAPEDIVPRQTGILWGPAKVGKTTLLATMPGNKLLINIDPDGYSAVAFRPDIFVIDLAPYEPDEIMRVARDSIPSMIEKWDQPPGSTIIVDSLSSYGWAALLAAIKGNVGGSSTFKATVEAPGLSAYGARTNYIISMVRNILKVSAKKNYHVWFTAHMDTPTTTAKGEFLYQTMTLSDNGVNQTSLSISEIWFMDRNDSKQTIAIQPVRGRKPMGSRMFAFSGESEFVLKYDINQPDTQEHSMSTWWNMYLANGRNKIPTPGQPAFTQLYKELMLQK